MGLIAFPQWKQLHWRSRRWQWTNWINIVTSPETICVNATQHTFRLVSFKIPTKVSQELCFETMVETARTLIVRMDWSTQWIVAFGTRQPSPLFLKCKVSRWGLRKKPKRRLTRFQSSLFSNPMNPITKNTDGTIAWDSMQGDRFLATGVDRYGKRFRTTSVDFKFIRCINLWRGTKWLVRNGKRYKLYSVYN